MPRFIVPDQGETNVLGGALIPGSLIKFHLFKNPIRVTSDTVLTDLTEADYDGYAAQTATLVTPTSGDSYLGLPGNKAFSGTYSALFPGNAGADQTVYGVWIEFVYPDTSFVLLGASNCFDPDNDEEPTGKNVSGIGDTTAVAFNIRLWDYLESQRVPANILFTGPNFDSYPYGSVQEVTATMVDGQGRVVTSYTGQCYPSTTDTTQTITVSFTLTSGVGVFNLGMMGTGDQVLFAATIDIPCGGGRHVDVSPP